VPPLSDVTLTFYPLYMRIGTTGGPLVRIRVSALALVSAARMAAVYGTAPDVLESIYSGALVFPVPGDEVRCAAARDGDCLATVVGEHRFGAVAYATGPEGCLARVHAGGCLGHELGHVAQDTRDAVLHAVPASDWALSRMGGVGRWLGRYVVLDGALPLMLLGHVAESPHFEGSCRLQGWEFYECEAEAMTR
jgi:hypothetical protein